MQIVLVGTPTERARLRAELNGSGVEIAAEFETLAQARAASIRADGVLLTQGSGFNELAAGEDEWIHQPLTAREVEVLELLTEGLPNKSIAERLGISDQTVKFHVSSICGKLGAANRTDAVRRALRLGLISL